MGKRKRIVSGSEAKNWGSSFAHVVKKTKEREKCIDKTPQYISLYLF
jgi:hypothetical protein